MQRGGRWRGDKEYRWHTVYAPTFDYTCYVNDCFVPTKLPG